ncbi:MAG: universal stress protein [Gammaproteobacteria bacterium]|nr:universal stress protein [Gammaproteobacteria bacterium]MXY53850.1 universal stress protein [Gammaproteobacteria bacterium]MYB36967.1 universal stress protein [Gammaproteobacteria bacterium]
MNAFEQVVVGLDVHQDNAALVLGRACELTDPGCIEAVHACTQLHHQHFEYPVGSFQNSEELDDAVRKQAFGFLERVCTPRGVAKRQVLDGRPAHALHDYAKNRADLVVVGSHGRSGPRAMFGSTSNSVLHGTPCDVLAVHLNGRGPASGNYERILVAVDLSDDSFEVLEHAGRVSAHCGAEVTLCTVTHDAIGEPTAQKLAHLADAFGVEEEAIYALSGNPVTEIHALATDIGADLVVVGTHGKHGLQLLAGSTANAILHGATCDVLAVRLRQQ